MSKYTGFGEGISQDERPDLISYGEGITSEEDWGL